MHVTQITNIVYFPRSSLQDNWRAGNEKWVKFYIVLFF